VAQHPLHDLDAHPLADEFAATRVPELVQRVAGRVGSVDEPSARTQAPPLVVQRVVGDGRAAVGAEQDFVRRGAAQGLDMRAQGAQGLRCRRRSEHDDALGPILGLADTHRLAAGVERHVAPTQGQDLAGAHAGLAQEGEDEPIRWRRHGDRRVKPTLFAHLADGARQTPAHASRSVAGQRVARAEVVADGPGEEAAEGGGAPADCARAGWWPGQPGLEIG